MPSIEELYNQACDLSCNGEVNDGYANKTVRRSGPHG